MVIPKLEIACFNLESAIRAQLGGADRIELCENRLAGGVTPSFELMKQATEKISIPIHIMIRPRGGNFMYSLEEFEEMKRKMTAFKNAGIDGFVFGILNESHKVDIEKNKELISLSNNLPCTLHKAFDCTNDLSESLEDAVKCGFSTILTSGGKWNAEEGLSNLSDLIRSASGRIEIMPGGGIRSSNIILLKEKLHAPFYHSSAVTDESDMLDSGEVIVLKQLLLS